MLVILKEIKVSTFTLNQKVFETLNDQRPLYLSCSFLIHCFFFELFRSYQCFDLVRQKIVLTDKNNWYLLLLMLPNRFVIHDLFLLCPSDQDELLSTRLTLLTLIASLGRKSMLLLQLHRWIESFYPATLQIPVGRNFRKCCLIYL